MWFQISADYMPPVYLGYSRFRLRVEKIHHFFIGGGKTAIYGYKVTPWKLVEIHGYQYLGTVENAGIGQSRTAVNRIAKIDAVS